MKKKFTMFAITTVILGAFGLASCTTTTTKENALGNTDKALAFINSFATGDETAVLNYVREDYTQHNLAFEDGRQYVAEALPALAASGTTVENFRAFEDGDYVVLQSKYNLFGAGEQAAFDVFRFENGKIVEHWDNLLAVQPVNPSGHTQFDGSVNFKDFDKTDENKALAVSFVEDVLMGRNPGKLTSYFDGNNYIQHNPAIADGLDGLGAALDYLAKNGVSMVYDKIHAVYGSGNFVLVISEGTYGTPDNPIPTSYYDLWRIDGGKIAEHWDVMESINQTPNAKNPNQKF